MIESACPFPQQETPSPTISQPIQILWLRSQTFSLIDRILLNMAAALPMGPWRRNKKHGYWLMLCRVWVYPHTTLWTPGARRIRRWDPACRTSNSKNIIAHIQPIKTASWFLVRYFQSVRLCNETPGTKTEALKWNWKYQRAPALQGVGLYGRANHFFALEMTQIHTDGIQKAFRLQSLLSIFFVSSPFLWDSWLQFTLFVESTFFSIWIISSVSDMSQNALNEH